MDEVIVVGMSVEDPSHRDKLARLPGVHIAFLQVADPPLTRVLTDLADGGATSIVLAGYSGSGEPPARSWLRRVAAHWLREYAGPAPELLLTHELLLTADPAELAELVDQARRQPRPVTGAESPLSSPAWEDVPRHRHQVFVCRGPRCAARGAGETAAALTVELMRHRLGDDDVLVTQTGCQYPCNQAPVVSVQPDDIWYGAVSAEGIAGIVAEHLVGGVPVEELRLPR